MPRNLIQVVTAAPPAINGVTDFALVVGKALRAECAIDSRFLVCNPSPRADHRVDGFDYRHVASRDPGDFCSALEALASERRTVVLVQLSPYGFEPSGKPFWLLAALRKWKEEDPEQRRLIVYFHELYGMSAPWRKAFWVSPLQRACTRGIARLSDFALTSVGRFARQLETWDGSKRGLIPCLPVVSSVGEPLEVRSVGERARRLVVWGSPQAKRDIYTRHLPTLEAAVADLSIDEIIDIGRPWRDRVEVAGIEARQLGVLTAQAIGGELQDAMLGALCTNPNYLGKSSLFASYSANGVPVLCLPTHSIESMQWDGIEHDVHYTTSPHGLAQDGSRRLHALASHARAWYFEHSASHHARAIMRSMAETPMNVR